MAIITMQTLSDYWKRIYDWIGTGATPNVVVTDLPDVTITGTPNVNISNASLVTTAQGNVAHGSPVSGNPVRVAGRSQTSNITAVASGSVVDLVCTSAGVQVQKPYSIPEADWSFTTPAITSTGDTVIKSATAGLRNYATGFQYQNTHATVNTEIQIKDGATVIFRIYAPAGMDSPASILFNTPLKSTSGVALNVACATTGANVYINAQGYQAP